MPSPNFGTDGAGPASGWDHRLRIGSRPAPESRDEPAASVSEQSLHDSPPPEPAPRGVPPTEAPPHLSPKDCSTAFTSLPSSSHSASSPIPERALAAPDPASLPTKPAEPYASDETPDSITVISALLQKCVRAEAAVPHERRNDTERPVVAAPPVSLAPPASDPGRSMQPLFVAAMERGRSRSRGSIPGSPLARQESRAPYHPLKEDREGA